MTQEEKELLIKDLSARIPYKVKASYYGTDEEMNCTDIIEGVIIENNDAEVIIGQYGLSVEKVKLYLYPLSSMTEEQQKEANIFDDMDVDILIENLGRNHRNKTNIPAATYNYIEWLNKNHFDYRGLIEKGLAIDVTNLNIY